MAEEKAAEARQQAQKRWPRRAKGGAEKQCSVADCKRPYRAKSYCYFHYKKWRQGELPHSRYRICSKPECRAKAARHGLCEKHFDETYKSPKGPAAEKESAAEKAAAPEKAPAAEKASGAEKAAS